MSTRARLVLGLTLAGAIALLAAAPALAKDNFPACIQCFFCGPGIPGSQRCGCPSMGSAPGSAICQNTPPPPCRLCHIQGTTGSGTIQTPFGVSMLAHGLSGSNTSVVSALGAPGMDKVDSDGDGTTDVTELDRLSDPNTAANVMWAQEPTPTYGCGVASGSRGGWLAASASILAALFVLRRTRRRP
jgi:hypothetical protein